MFTWYSISQICNHITQLFHCSAFSTCYIYHQYVTSECIKYTAITINIMKMKNNKIMYWAINNVNIQFYIHLRLMNFSSSDYFIFHNLSLLFLALLFWTLLFQVLLELVAVNRIHVLLVGEKNLLSVRPSKSVLYIHDSNAIRSRTNCVTAVLGRVRSDRLLLPKFMLH